METATRKVKPQIVCFGEVLWDILPNCMVPGGAPMNVSYHLNRLKKSAALITRIGNDKMGSELRTTLSKTGMYTGFFQVDNEYETGKVFASLNDLNEVSYDIVNPAAWDFIAWQNDYLDAVKEATYFVYGSLACRNNASRKTLFSLLEIAGNKVLDINLRGPHFSYPVLFELLRKADFLKLNKDELDLISSGFSNHKTVTDKMFSIMDRFDIRNIVVTMGSEGAFLFMEDQLCIHPGFKVPVRDTIGSGDAFLAGLLSKLLDWQDPMSALEYACGLGALVATYPGACPDYAVSQVERLIKIKPIYTKRYKLSSSNQ